MKNDLRSLWEQRLAEHEASGKSIAAWCKEQSLRDNQFYYWRKKLRLGQVKNNQPVKWLSLELEASLAPDSIAVHVGQVTVDIKKDLRLYRSCKRYDIKQASLPGRWQY